MLMNVGYVEAKKAYDFACFIFHDVDLLPENDRNLYSCPGQPRHMSVAIDKFNYNLPYGTILGGVSAFTDEQFSQINGFPNIYWGWGELAEIDRLFVDRCEKCNRNRPEVNAFCSNTRKKTPPY